MNPDSFNESVKRAIANSDRRVNEKFRKALPVPWQGRFVLTVNGDPELLRSLPILPNIEKP